MYINTLLHTAIWKNHNFFSITTRNLSWHVGPIPMYGETLHLHKLPYMEIPSLPKHNLFDARNTLHHTWNRWVNWLTPDRINGFHYWYFYNNSIINQCLQSTCIFYRLETNCNVWCSKRSKACITYKKQRKTYFHDSLSFQENLPTVF